MAVWEGFTFLSWSSELPGDIIYESDGRSDHCYWLIDWMNIIYNNQVENLFKLGFIYMCLLIKQLVSKFNALLNFRFIKNLYREIFFK